MRIKKIDTLIIKSFVGPFVLTTFVATFILLIQYMLKYFDDFVGKNLGFAVFGELITYFSLNMLSISLPLGVLVSSLMTFGNLGEHFELTAIKGAGISLLRTLRPIAVFVFFLSIGAFYFNNYVVPAANLKAYSLLYDIKHTKPALDIKPGVFYNGIPDYSIKAKEKLADNQTLKEVLIYDHTQKLGNKAVIIADSSKMYTFLNDRYLKLELYDGSIYREDKKSSSAVDYMYRTSFNQMEIVFDLSSFGLRDTDEALFRNNRQMKNVGQLTNDIDSLRRTLTNTKNKFRNVAKGALQYHLANRVEAYIVEEPNVSKKDSTLLENIKSDTIVQEASFLPLAFLSTLFQEGAGSSNQKLPAFSSPTQLLSDSSTNYRLRLVNPTAAPINRDLEMSKTVSQRRREFKNKLIDSLTWSDLDVFYHQTYQKKAVIDQSLSQARSLKSQLTTTKSRVENLKSTTNKFAVEKYKKFSQAAACFVMFLIGAPLGAIIKKGGLGVPVIVSIFFFIVYYVLTITSEKWAKAGVTEPIWSVWVADLTLFPIGLFFLRQARVDARLFDSDFYNVVIDKVRGKWMRRKQTAT